MLLSGDSEYCLEVGKSLGVDWTVHRHNDDTTQIVREEMQGRGVDVVMDDVGTAALFMF